MKKIWTKLWKQYKSDWKKAWKEYKTLIGPFIKGTAKYLWLLIYGLIELLAKGLYACGELLVARIIAWFNKI